jgi:hypothetical protein
MVAGVGYLSSSTIFLDTYVHKTVLNNKPRERNNGSRKLEDKIKHSGDNEDPQILLNRNKLYFAILVIIKFLCYFASQLVQIYFRIRILQPIILIA